MKIYSAYSDNELVALLSNGDELAFAEIYNRFWSKLLVVALNRCNNQLDAEEVVQEIFYSLWKRRTTLQLRHGLNTYLSVAVKYKVINILAKRHQEKLHLDSLPHGELIEETTTRWINERELKNQIEQGINSLPEKCRIVFLMSRDEGKSASQIAQELGISQKTVEAHLGKALKDLRNSLNVTLPVLLYLIKK